MTAETTSSRMQAKEIAVEWAKALFQGDRARFRALTHPEFETVMVGDMPVCGKRDLKSFLSFMHQLRNNAYAPGPFKMMIGAVTAEDDRVCMEAESYIPLKNGRVYNNYYIWTMIVRDGKVIRLKEMLDTLHVHRVFDGPEYEGETESRVNYLFDEPSIVIVGNMAPAD